MAMAMPMAAAAGLHLVNNLRCSRARAAAPALINNFMNFNSRSSTKLCRPSHLTWAYKVVIEEANGEKREVEVEADETILSKALESGVEVPYDCKLGVCMTCPARLVAGKVDQSEGMLSDDVVERGYALLCSSYPLSDCHIKIIPEDELLSLQLATAND